MGVGGCGGWGWWLGGGGDGEGEGGANTQNYIGSEATLCNY